LITSDSTPPLGVAEMDKPQNATNIDVNVVRSTVETNLFGLITATTTFLPLLRNPSPVSPRVILNVTSDMASNAYQARPNSGLHFTAYNTSKAAANSYTIALAKELEKEGIKVNAVTPGFTSTKLNGYGQGGKSVSDGAERLVPFALLGEDGPTCQFFDENGKIFAW